MSSYPIPQLTRVSTASLRKFPLNSGNTLFRISSSNHISLRSATQRFAAIILLLSGTVIAIEHLSFKSASFHRHQVYNSPTAAPAENESPSSSSSSNQDGYQTLSYALPTSANERYLPYSMLQDRNPSANSIGRRFHSTILQAPKKATVNETTILQRHTSPPPPGLQISGIARSEEQHPFCVTSLREIWGNPIGYFLQLYVTLTILQRSYHPIESVD
jgi:hypothetical protein